MNFRQLEPGTAFGRTRLAFPLDVRDEGRRDVSEDYFACSDGTITLRRTATPAMLTLDARVVRQDCLCYLMERLPFPSTWENCCWHQWRVWSMTFCVTY
jgi:succinylglutamate desuccinylase